MPMSSFFIGAITSRVGSSHFLSRISLPKWVHVSGEGVSKVNCCMINRGSEPSPFFHRTCLRIEFEVRPVVIKAQIFFNHFKRISSCQCPSHNGIWSSRKLSLVTVMSFFDFIFFCPSILSHASKALIDTLLVLQLMVIPINPSTLCQQESTYEMPACLLSLLLSYPPKVRETC